MSPRKDVVETYIEGLRRGDHELILSCLIDDVVWKLPGYTTVTGKDAFDKEIENDDTVGSRKLTIDRLIEEADTVVAVGRGRSSGEVATSAPSSSATYLSSPATRSAASSHTKSTSAESPTDCGRTGPA